MFSISDVSSVPLLGFARRPRFPDRSDGTEGRSRSPSRASLGLKDLIYTVVLYIYESVAHGHSWSRYAQREIEHFEKSA